MQTSHQMSREHDSDQERDDTIRSDDGFEGVFHEDLGYAITSLMTLP